MKRRHFLKTAPLFTLPLLIKGFPVEAMDQSPLLQLLGQQSLKNGRVLVLVQLNGGNDGLNTVIALDRYAELTNARSNILIPQTKVLTLNNSTATGLHPSMTEMQTLYNAGMMNIVQGVSYPNPNFSHFRATDIWLTGASSNQYLTTGWLGRTLDEQFTGYPESFPNADMPDPLAIQIGSQASTMTQTAETNAAFTVTDPSSFYNFVNGSTDILPNSPYGNELSFLRLKQQQTNQYAGVIKAANAAGTNLATYPANNSLANQLKIVAKLIKGGLKTPLYIVNHPNSFDTHTNQTDPTDHTIGTHANALAILSKAIGAFQQDLGMMNIQDRVTGMTFTEFGRRIKSNASVGTDHGTSIPMFFFGSKLNPALTGTSPVLPANAGVNDQIPMQFDFRSVYYTVLKDWFELTDADLSAALYQPYDTLPIFNEKSIPVTVLSFTGDWKSNQVTLNWTAAASDGIGSFDIQRSDDGIQFTSIGKQNSVNRTTAYTYTYHDRHLSASQYYYRIQLNEKSGTTRVTNTLLLKDSSHLNGIRVKILPNPIDNWFTVSFQDKVSGDINVRMLELSGKEVWKAETQASDAYNLTFTIDKSIMPGIYIIQVKSKDYQLSSKVLLR
jgi:uncharacterized protein (DUF1501 family)